MREMTQAESRLRNIPSRVHTVFLPDVTPDGPLVGRRYTLTRSDRTGHFYVSVGLDYHQAQIDGAYTRFKRDEVLAEWLRDSESDADDDGPSNVSLHVYAIVSGGRVFGSAAQRNRTLQRTLPVALQALRYADKYLVTAHPTLDKADIFVHFQSDVEKYQRTEQWSPWCEYAPPAYMYRR